MTAVDVDALDKLREAATAGPWHVEQHSVLEKGCRCLSCWELVDAWDIREVDGPDCAEHGCWHNISLGEPDAALVAAAVNALPDLIAEVRRGRALREAVVAIVDEMEDDESIGIPPNVPLLIAALRSVVAAVDGGEQ